MKRFVIVMLVLLSLCAVVVAQTANAPKVEVMKTDFGALEPFTITYNEGGGPQGGILPSPWGTNLWNAGSKAESGVAEEPSTKMRALYMTNIEGTPAVQMFTLKPLQLKANQNYLASFVYMTEGDATGRFEVRFEGEGADTMDKVGENLDRIGIWKERVVPFTTPASGLAGFQFSTGSVGKKIYLREFHLREGPKAWKPQPEELGAPGARIDEKQIKQIFYVNPSHARAADSNSVKPTSRYNIRGGAEKSHEYSQAGIPTKIELRQVFIREGGFAFDAEKVGGKAVDTLFCHCGERAGKVMMSGADASGWSPSRGRWLMPKNHLQARLGTNWARRMRCTTSRTTPSRNAAKCWC
jgi:hypothetical protein